MVQSLPRVISPETAAEYQFFSLRDLKENQMPELLSMVRAIEEKPVEGGLSLDSVFKASFIEQYSARSDLIGAVDKPKRSIFLIEHTPTEELVGLLTYYNESFVNNPCEYDIANSTIYIAPNGQGRNLGKLSLEKLRSLAQHHELENAVIQVNQGNEASIRNLEFMVSAGLAEYLPEGIDSNKDKIFYKLNTSAGEEIFWTALANHKRLLEPSIL